MEETTFQEEKMDLVLNAFKTFDFEHVSSWPEIELWAAVNGVEIDLKFVCTLLVGTRVFDTLFNSFISCLREDTFLDSFANTVEFVECLFRVYDGVGIATKTALIPPSVRAFEKWIADNEICYCSDTFDSLKLKTTAYEKKYEFLDVLDAKFPYLLVKFYERRKRDLHMLDIEFVKWLSVRFKAKALTGGTLKAVSDALDMEMAAQWKTSMFMQ